MRSDSLHLIGRRPLLLATAALVLAVLPLIGRLTPWVLVLFVGSAVMRTLIEFRSARLPGLLFRACIAVAGTAAVLLQYGALTGLEPGLAVLLVLSSVKIMEARRPRDFQVMVALGWFLCLAQLFFFQDLLNCLYAGVVFLMLAAALVQVHRRPEKETLPSLRVAGVLILQAVPLAIVLFLLFPRSYGGFRFHVGQSLFGRTGMSDRLYPGSIANVAESDAIAFRVYFGQAQVPSYPSLYWRGGVLSRGNGLNWSMEPMGGRASEHLAGPGMWQQIVIEPHGQKWMFALDWPADTPRGTTMEPGNFLRSREPIYSTLRYEVVSRPVNRETRLPRFVRKQALELPPEGRISPAVRELVAGWRAESASDSEVAEAALRYFRKNDFRYTLFPGSYSSKALDEFLFDRREGFCEHYAGAFATLMRVAGIPSRVVVGYQGGEFNRHGNYVIVRQSDAHAWCEIWREGAGWQRVDPTASIAPERTTLGLDSYLESAASRAEGASPAQRSEGAIGFREIVRDLGLVWDAVNYQWDLRVLNFDADAQRTFLASLGFGSVAVPDLLAWLLGGTALALAGLTGAMRWRARPRPDPVARSYAIVCRRLSRAGVARNDAEGPLSLRDRAIGRFPHREEQIRALFDLYVRLRYGMPGEAPTVRAFARAVAGFRPGASR